MRLTLKNRIFASFAVVILLFAFSSVLFIEFYVKNMLHEETIEDGRATASMIAAQISQLAYSFDYMGIDAVFQKLIEGENEIAYILFVQDGKVLSKAVRSSLSGEVLSLEQSSGGPGNRLVELAGKTYYDFSMPLSIGDPKLNVGVLRVGIDERLGDEAVRHMIVSIVFIALALVIVALTLAHFLASRLSRPISNLTATASLVTGGDLSGLAAVESDDEIGELAASFNEMILAVRAREQELRDANVELETVNVSLHQYIEELKQAKTDLLKAQQDAAVLDTSRAFMHHLRQPLTYLLMATEMLLDELRDADGALNESVELKLRTVEEAGKQISTLLRKLERIKTYKPMEFDEYSKIIDIDA